MDRRAFLSGFSQTVAATGAAAAVVVSAIPDKPKASIADGAEKLREQYKRLNKRVDDMEESHKRLVKALIVVVSVSTGFDALTLLKGDPFS